MKKPFYYKYQKKVKPRYHYSYGSDILWPLFMIMLTSTILFILITI